MGKKSLKWELFQEKVVIHQIKIGMIFGKGRRAHYIELIMPAQFSVYISVSDKWTLIVPKERVVEIYDVNPVFKSHYEGVQDFLKQIGDFGRSGLGGVSINGDFIITSDNIMTFSKEISQKDVSVVSDLKRSLRDLEEQTGVNLEDSPDSTESSKPTEELEEGADYKIKLVGVDSSDSQDSREEMEKFVAKSSKGLGLAEETMGIAPAGIETFEIGVLYPLMTVVEMVKRGSSGKGKTPTLVGDLTVLKDRIRTLDQKYISDSIAAVGKLLDDVSHAFATKIARFSLLEETLVKDHQDLKKIHDNAQRLLSKGIIINEEKLKTTVSKTQKELRDKHIDILRTKEATKRTIRTYSSLLGEVLNI